MLALASPASAGSREVLATLHFQNGTITLGDNLAVLAQTDNFHYLDNAGTETFLTNVWANPPGAGKDALGTIVPKDTDPLGADGWAVIISYDDTGYVSDEDAGKIDYDDLMREMQKAIEEASKERVAKGLPSLELIGWARKPYYDAAAKKMVWAKRLRFGNSNTDTLNYNIRILGRRGVLNLNVVAPMAALQMVDQRAPSILAMVHFNQGNTYAEFNPRIDKAAAYGLAGLIAGGVLVKAGFLKGLLALLLASWKIVGVTVLAAVAAMRSRIKRLFGGAPKPTVVAASLPPTEGGGSSA